MKAYLKVKRFFEVFFFAFLLVVAFLSLSVFAAIRNQGVREHYGWPLMNHVLSTGILILAFWLFSAYLARRKIFGMLWALTGLFLRFMGFHVFQDSLIPWSDFLYTWNIACGNAAEETIQYKSFFPEWSNWAALQRLLVHNLGFNYRGIVFLDFTMCCIASLEIYVIAKLVSDNEAIANLALISYVFMPSQVLYSYVTTPDAFAMPFYLGAIILIVILIQDNYKSVRQKIIFTIAIGVLLGIGSSFKPIGFIFFIGYIIVETWKMLGGKKSTISFCGLICAIFSVGFVMFGIHSGARLVSEDVLHESINKSAAPHYLLVGLNTDSEGQYWGSKSGYYIELLREGRSEKEAAYETFEFIKQDWKSNQDKIGTLFLKKIRWA